MVEAIAEGWFVAPTAVRDDLTTEGIVPDPTFDGGEIWLFDDRELAEMAAQVTVAQGGYVSTPEGCADVWQVDLSGLGAAHRTHIQNRAKIQHVGSIEPLRLALHITY